LLENTKMQSKLSAVSFASCRPTNITTVERQVFSEWSSGNERYGSLGRSFAVEESCKRQSQTDSDGWGSEYSTYWQKDSTRLSNLFKQMQW